MIRGCALGLGLVAWLIGLGAAPDARAESCRIMQLSMTPAAQPQVVAWVEDAQGTFLETVYITQATGTYGLGNRPGLLELNSEWRWPYGRRPNVFPVWSHRRGVEVPEVVFHETWCAATGGTDASCTGTETDQEFDLSHPIAQSSRETYYCRPLDPGSAKDKAMIDAMSCATPVFTDKGALHPSAKSLYPPRSDVTVDPTRDHPDVSTYPDLNDLDAVSRATPPAGEPFTLNTLLPQSLVAGNYVLWVEVAAEFDDNSFYKEQCTAEEEAAGCRSFPMPGPDVIPNWRQYGAPYRGQPSVLWKVPFQVSAMGETRQQALDYVGYGDPNGQDGAVSPPDKTISTGTPGSGAERLAVQVGPNGDERVGLRVVSDEDGAVPGAPELLGAVDATDTSATVRFTAPADDGSDVASGKVTEYEVRLLVGQEMTEANFADGVLVTAPDPDVPGTEQSVVLEGLLPQTSYSLGLRAKDKCLNQGALRLVSFKTGRSMGGTVDPVGCCQIGARGHAPPWTGSLLVVGLWGAGVVGRRRRAALAKPRDLR